MRAELNRRPGYTNFFTSQGLTVDEIFVIPGALINACILAVLTPDQAQKALAGDALPITPAQVAFCREHKAEIDKLKWAAPEEE